MVPLHISYSPNKKSKFKFDKSTKIKYMDFKFF